MAKMQKRKGKNNWEVCYPLPVKLRNTLKTPALNRSLGTSDKAEAKRRYPMKLIEVETEIAQLMMKYFPDDDTVFAELTNLMQTLKEADVGEGRSDEIADKDVVLDAMIGWGERQRRKRLNAYRGTPHYEEQKAIADGIRDEADEMVQIAIDPRIRITELVEQWRKDRKPLLAVSTQEDYERNIKKFLAWCKKKKYLFLQEITRKDVRAYVEDCYVGNLGKTVKIGLGAMRGVWDHAHTIGDLEEKSRVWLDHDYSDRIRVGTGEVKSKTDHEMPFSFDEIDTVLKGVKPQEFADVYRFGLVSGARSAEMVALKPEHVTKEKDGFWVDLPGTKSECAPRLVPIPVEFNPFMERLVENSKGKNYLIPLYPKKDGKWKDERDRNRYINKELNRKRRGLKMPNSKKQGVHSTRRTYMEMLEGAGVYRDTIKLLVGHKRDDITLGTYSKGQYVDRREAAEKLKYPVKVTKLINKGNKK